jgi:NAD(P)-dependent dehydrogenase (short-subunit alcohol dehydrogenase family)
MAKHQKSVVVTGVSTGIGWGATKVLTKAGFRVFGSVRKDADAKKLSAEFGANFVPLIFDVVDEKAVRAAATTVRQALGGERLFGLVNNAGIAVAGPLVYMPVEDFRQQIDVNLTGVVIATQAFAPLLGIDPDLKGKPGRIVNISSVGGKSASPFLGAYNTSKFGLEGMSEALRRELMLFDIDVIVIAPGAVATAIWGKAGEAELARYANTPYATQLAKLQKIAAEQGRKGLKPEVLGRAIMKALTVARPKVRYTVTPEPVLNFVLNTVPRRTADRMIAGRLGLKPRET